MVSEMAGRALEALDQALSQPPHAASASFSAAAQGLSTLRDALAARQRHDGADADGRRRLEHVNAVISVVLAGHFPLGPVPWDELRRARQWLADIAASLHAAEAGR